MLLPYLLVAQRRLELLFHRNVYLSQRTPYPTLPMELRERITIDPNICHGKPCIRGLRYPVEVILELLSAGMTTEEILADYEDLEREDVLAYAARLSRIKRVQSVLA